MVRVLQAGMRRALKEAASTMLERSGGRELIAHLQRVNAGGRRVSILAWHRVVPDFEGMRRKVIPGLLTSTTTFDRQLEWLSRSFQILPLGEALEVLAGRQRSDRDVCVLTFDDGYADFLEHAVPILRRRGLPATVFVSSGHVDTGEPFLHDRLYRLLRILSRERVHPKQRGLPDDVRDALARAPGNDAIVVLEHLLEHHPRERCVKIARALERSFNELPLAAAVDSQVLGWDELRAVHAAGIQVGAHTVDHRCLPNESWDEVERQLQVSRRRIEEELSCEIPDFAYPNGWYSRRAIRQVARAGYRSAVTTEDRLNRLGHDPLVLGRKCVWEFTSRGAFGYSPAINSCNLDGTLHFLGAAGWVSGERIEESVGI